jgi:hypothetical protein
MFHENDVVKRLDNGRPVRIVEVLPNGLRVFYRTVDLQDGHTAIFSQEQLRARVVLEQEMA